MKLSEIRDHLKFWEGEARDLNPYNVDSKDLVHEVHPALAERAVKFLPVILKEFHDFVLKTKLEKYGTRTIRLINQEHPELIDTILELYEIAYEKRTRGVLTYGKHNDVLVWSIFNQGDAYESTRDQFSKVGKVKKVDVHYKNVPTGENWIQFYANKVESQGPDLVSTVK